MKLLTAKVQVPYVPVQFNPRTESSPLAAIDREPPHRHGALDRTEKCWQLLANNDCEPLDDSEIEKMLMLIEEKLEILLEVESYETNNHLQANLNEEIEELEWQQDALRKEVNRRNAMDILKCRKRTSSRGAPIQGAGTGSSGRINRGFSQPEMISNGNADGAVRASNPLPREAVLETQPNPVQQTAAKTKPLPRKLPPRRPMKKPKRRRIIIEY